MNPQNSSKSTKSQHKSKTKHTNIKQILGEEVLIRYHPCYKKHIRLGQAGIVDFHPIYWYQIIKTYKKKKKKGIDTIKMKTMIKTHNGKFQCQIAEH